MRIWRPRTGTRPRLLTSLSFPAQCRPAARAGRGKHVVEGRGITQPDGASRLPVPGIGARVLNPAPPMAVNGQCFIAADVGGTNARVALVRASDDGRIAILAYRRYPC